MSFGTHTQQLRETIDSYSSERRNILLPLVHMHVYHYICSVTQMCPRCFHSLKAASKVRFT